MWHHRVMRRTLVTVGMLVGCSYSEPHIADDNGGGDDASDPPRTCPTDSALRLCVQFDGTLGPTFVEGMSHVVHTANVTPMLRASESAAHVDASSTMLIEPGDATNLSLTMLTVEMWIAPDHRPGGGATYWMIDNNTEYGIEFR